jgi:hypothetical protein
MPDAGYAEQGDLPASSIQHLTLGAANAAFFIIVRKSPVLPVVND